MLLYRSGYFVFVGLIMMGLGLYFHFTDRWQAMSDKITSFEKAKREAELAVLKAQVHPHFLFNVLNSIYGLSLEKSDKTSESILKLSNLMSYVLYDFTKNTVKLKNELDFLESYIELEKLRFEDKIDVKLNLEVDFPEIEIAPLIFIPFVENAFKHFGSDNEEVPHVHFSLQMKSEQYIVFKSSNSVSVNGS
jgi:two-component system LytT family sensor kinase